MPLIEPTPPPLPANPPPSSVVSFAATTMAPELTDASLANAVDITSNTLSIQGSETNTENDKIQLISSDIEIETQKIINNTEVKIKESSVQITDTLNEKLSNNSSSDEQPKQEENISNDIQKDNNNSESVVKSESPFNGVDIANNFVIETEQSKQKLTDTVLDDQNQTENLLVKQIDDYNEVQVNEANVEKNEKSAENDKVVSESNVIDSNVDSLIENVEIEKENLLNKSKISIDHSEIVENKKDDRVIINGDLPAEDDPAEADKPIIVTLDESLPPPPSDAMEPLQDDGEAASNGVASTDVASDDVANAELASNGADDSFPPPPSELCRSDSDVSPDTLQVNTAGYSCSSRRLVS